MPFEKITIVGAGLAGCEAAWQAAEKGVPVELVEMKPLVFSPAHKSPLLAELVCSNSLRSQELHNAVGLLKEEMRLLGSLVIESARLNRVPAGSSLAVDREGFAGWITEKMRSHHEIALERREVKTLPESRPLVVATGPLTADPLALALSRLVGSRRLHFYDAIAPIVQADSIDLRRAYRGSRYGKGGADYINCPMDEEQYLRFLEALLQADAVPPHPFEEVRYFEGCLPVEVMACRGPETLRYGPLKPVGLPDPRTGKIPHAVVQLRQDNRAATFYNMVGFQTKLKWRDQERVFRLIPGLEQAEFARLGSIHRNTFIEGPKVLHPTLELREHPGLFLAGQITGVEGYVESAAMGLLAGLNAARLAEGASMVVPPATTALGGLVGHVTRQPIGEFQPMNVNFGLLPPLAGKVSKKQRGDLYAQRALTDLRLWMEREGLGRGAEGSGP